MSRLDPKEISSEITSMKQEINFPVFTAKHSLAPLFENLLNSDFIQKMDGQTAQQYLLQISAYSLYVQIEQNKIRSYLNWCESNIKHIVGKELINVPREVGTYFTSQDVYIRANHKTANDLEEEKLKCQAKLDIIFDITKKMDFICDALKTIIYSKRKDHESIRSN